MKKFTKILTLFACFALMFSFAACNENETKEQVIAKINAAIEKTDSEASYDSFTEMERFAPAPATAWTTTTKVINNSQRQIGYKAIADETDSIEDYYVDGYLCTVYHGEYTVAEADFADFEEHFGASESDSGIEFSDANVKSWSKSVDGDCTTYKVSMEGGEIPYVADWLGVFDEVADLTMEIEVTINAEWYVTFLKISLNIVADGTEFSAESKMTFNAFGDDVAVDVPDAVNAAIADFIAGQEDEPAELPQ